MWEDPLATGSCLINVEDLIQTSADGFGAHTPLKGLQHLHGDESELRTSHWMRLMASWSVSKSTFIPGAALTAHPGASVGFHSFLYFSNVSHFLYQRREFIEHHEKSLQKSKNSYFLPLSWSLWISPPKTKKQWNAFMSNLMIAVISIWRINFSQKNLKFSFLFPGVFQHDSVLLFWQSPQ